MREHMQRRLRPYTYYPWNRLVKVEVGSNTKAEYEYNGLNWRIIKQLDTPGSAVGLDQQRMRYYAGGLAAVRRAHR